MTLLTRKMSMSWIAGTVAVPVAVATYRVQDVGTAPEKSVNLPDTSLIGAFQNDTTRAGGLFLQDAFTTEWRGHATDSVPPSNAALLRAAGFSETAQGVSFLWALADLHLASGTPAGVLRALALDFYRDGDFVQAQNSVLDCTFNFIAGNIPTINWTFRGQADSTKKGAITQTPPAFSSEENPRPVQSGGLTTNVIRGNADDTGTVTGASSATVLIDSAATFQTSLIQVGDQVTLDVGGETATVVSIDSETQLTSTTLSNAGMYDSAEAYTIVPSARVVSGTSTGGASNTILIDSTATFITSGVLIGDTVQIHGGTDFQLITSVDSETQVTTATSTDDYDTTAYNIIRTRSLTVSSEVVPSIIYAVGNIIDDRADINGAHGFSAPILTGRAPRFTVVIEIPPLERWNFERAYVENEVHLWTWKTENGGGTKHETTWSASGVLNNFPPPTDRNGKLVYTLTYDQDPNGTLFNASMKGS